MLLVRLVYYFLKHKGHIYRFRMFEHAGYFFEKSRSRLKRRCRGGLGDQCEYESEPGKSGGARRTGLGRSSSAPR